MYIHWSALVVILLLMATSVKSPVLAVITVCSYFGIVLLHEAGHAFVAKQLGYRPIKISLGFLHGQCEYEAPYSKKHNSIIAWGGVLAQIAVAIPLIVLSKETRVAEVYGFGPVVAFLGYISLMIALLNLAPSPFLDGAKAWSLLPILLSEWREKGKRKKRIHRRNLKVVK